MDRPPPSRSVQRARWLAELSHALDDAHALSLEVGRERPASAEAIALRQRIAAAKAEVDALRRGKPTAATSRKKERPTWLDLLGLTPPAEGRRRR